MRTNVKHSSERLKVDSISDFGVVLRRDTYVTCGGEKVNLSGSGKHCDTLDRFNTCFVNTLLCVHVQMVYTIQGSVY